MSMLITHSELKELLLRSKSISEKSLLEVEKYASNFRISLSEAVVEKGILTDEDLGSLLATHLGVSFTILSKKVIGEDVLRIIPERIARKYKIVAFDETKDEVKLGMTNPTHADIVSLIAKKTAKKISVHLATEQDMTTALQSYRRDLQDVIDTFIKRGRNGLGETPIEAIIDTLITFAYRDKASDIHIEPEEDTIIIRFRIDSILKDVVYIDKRFHGQIVTRIKVLARLQTDEHLNPQDGKMRMHIDEENLDVRVSILPITEGEKVVLRLLSSRFRQFSLAQLGMNKKDLKKISNAVGKDHGLILSTGPTGSGKTTSIYSILKTLNTREKNITTIEDPVEYAIKGVNQFQVNIRTKLSFANGLRSILRQDPNVIFVGEIRDSETAGIAVNAALTGHLVLSTLHTNDAATALPRLIDMKVEPFLVASTVNVIIAQRLVRKICTSCKTSIMHTRSEMRKHFSEKTITKYFGHKERITLFEAKGCKLCHNSGYAGRVGLFEVMEVSEKIKRLIAQKEDSEAIEKQAIVEGMTTMLDDGLEKVIDGLTTIEELLRVMKTASL